MAASRSALLGVLALSVAVSASACSENTNAQSCHYVIECYWCQAPNGTGRCHWWKDKPEANWTCDNMEGCGGLRMEGDCDADPKCKWCDVMTQGQSWQTCADISDDVPHCDKKKPIVEPALAADGCSVNTDIFQCHYNIECIWCQSSNTSRCMNWTGTPKPDEKCDSLAGCSGHRTASTCDGDQKCKWCTSHQQGWPFCANLSAKVESADCDKEASSDLLVV